MASGCQWSEFWRSVVVEDVTFVHDFLPGDLGEVAAAGVGQVCRIPGPPAAFTVQGCRHQRRWRFCATHYLLSELYGAVVDYEDAQKILLDVGCGP